MTQPRMPTVYINHGGGPLPLLGQQPDVSSFLKGSMVKASSHVSRGRFDTPAS